MKMNLVWAVGLVVGLSAVAGCDRAPKVEESGSPVVVEEQQAVVEEPVEAAGSEEAEEGWSQVSMDELDEVGLAKLEKANAAREELAKRLMGRVMEASKADGFAAAVDVCHGEAPVITAEVAKKHGVKIGRTSDKLRNSGNTGVEWANSLFNEEGTAAVVVAGDGSLGTLNPIMLAEPCANCHGAKDNLAPGVAEALAAKYPGDEAVGYAPGDLRGWFWVEVPGS